MDDEDCTQMYKVFEQLSNQNATMRGGSCLKAAAISNIQHCNFVSIFAYSMHEKKLQLQRRRSYAASFIFL